MFAFTPCKQQLFIAISCYCILDRYISEKESLKLAGAHVQLKPAGEGKRISDVRKPHGLLKFHGDGKKRILESGM